MATNVTFCSTLNEEPTLTPLMSIMDVTSQLSMGVKTHTTVDIEPNLLPHSPINTKVNPHRGDP